MTCPPITRRDPQGDQALPLQGAEQPAQVARVKTESPAQLGHVEALADLPQDTRLAHRSVSTQEVVVEGTDGATDGPVEGPDPPDVTGVDDA